VRAYLTYAERKIIGYMQIRLGPNRVGPKGWLQPIADAVKLMFKEIIIPSGSNKFLFLLAPILVLAPALAAWAVMPFTAEMVLANVDASLLYIMAITSMGVYGVVVAGWLPIPNTLSSAPCARRRKSCRMKSPWASRWWAC